MKTKFTCIGLMSGTSLDGIDIAFCEFDLINNQWQFKILKAETITYSKEWIERLQKAPFLNAYNFMKLNIDYGNLLGNTVKLFIAKHNIIPEFIASHGHTIFHNPKDNITTQIGAGANICSKTGITTIFDFRALDVALNGQGAPLVPVGDALLFSEYDACINLGGFANVSFSKNNERFAFDICPVNIVVNELVKERGLSYDKDGLIAEKGNINNMLVKELNKLDFYKINPPKSLGREWIESFFMPIINKYDIPLEDKLRSIYEHIAFQINKNTDYNFVKNILFTGGGAYNIFLMKLIRENSNKEILIPSNVIIDFKEALIFAFLGVLRISETANCLSSVTGANYDNIGGCVVKGKLL